jgi:hypothetical protein
MSTQIVLKASQRYYTTKRFQQPNAEPAWSRKQPPFTHNEGRLDSSPVNQLLQEEMPRSTGSCFAANKAMEFAEVVPHIATGCGTSSVAYS